MKLKDSFLASHSQREKNSGWLESRKRLPVFKPNPASKMIQVLLVIICLAVFPFQGSSKTLKSGNVNDYEVVNPGTVTGLPKGAVEEKHEPMKGNTLQKFPLCTTGPCCRQCKLKPAGTTCWKTSRTSHYCTGKSCDCPMYPGNG